MTESPSALLERAATKLESLATATTSGEWQARELHDEPGLANVLVESAASFGGFSSLFTSSCCGGHCYGHVDKPADATWIATLSPVVAQPLANILRGVAFTLSCHPEYADMNRDYITLARVILGEELR